MISQIVRGPLLIPNADGSVSFHRDGALVADSSGCLEFAGAINQLRDTGLWPVLASAESQGPWNPDEARTGRRPVSQGIVRISDGIMLPPMIDYHTHIPQHPIRGRFCEGVGPDPEGGRLLAGLNRNVFPAEAKCSEMEHAEQVIRQFLTDTVSHGVVGGAAYMTVSAAATELALAILPPSWSVGLVLMNQNCPENLRSDEPRLEADIERLTKRFGRRLIVTDRFAVAVNSPLRRRASSLAEKFALRTQTHLNEQVAEKHFIETKLYPDYMSYTEVYKKDGLLNHDCIAAHCIQMTDDEWRILRDTGSSIAHCPTSNLLLGSGVMPLEQVLRWNVPYALGTDVGASPTVSMLAEMKRFLHVHAAHSDRATAEQALYRSTRASADLLEICQQFGRLEKGQPMSFIEVDSSAALSSEPSTEAVIRSLLPADLDHPRATVQRVTIQGKTIFHRSGNDA
jgi:guanine deaminase